MNNYWMTNFRAAQPGVVHLRYELSVESAHSPSRSAHMAALACQVPDIEVHPIIQADTATAGPMVELSTDQWTLLAVEPGPVPRSILVRLLNDTMQPVQGELSLGRKTISGAWRVNLCDGDELDTLSVKDGRAQLTIPARTFATVRIVTPR